MPHDEEPEIEIDPDQIDDVMAVLFATDEPEPEISSERLYDSYCAGTMRMTPYPGLHIELMIAWFCGLFQKLPGKA